MTYDNTTMRYLLDLLFPPRPDVLILRGISNDGFCACIAPRLVRYTSPGTVALLPFNTPAVRAAIHEAKYHGNKHAFILLAEVLAEYLRDADDVGRTMSSIRLVPVPLGEQRRKERGFNQIEEIVHHATQLFADMKIDTTLLERTRETTSQISLPRKKREENMRGAFACLPAGRARIDPSYTYIVIDDVLTTGATLQAAIDALTAAGAIHIIPLALAH